MHKKTVLTMTGGLSVAALFTLTDRIYAKREDVEALRRVVLVSCIQAAESDTERLACHIAAGAESGGK